MDTFVESDALFKPISNKINTNSSVDFYDPTLIYSDFMARVSPVQPAVLSLSIPDFRRGTTQREFAHSRHPSSLRTGEEPMACFAAVSESINPNVWPSEQPAINDAVEFGVSSSLSLG